jgi:GDPmannose 4,6-dehydratase
MNALIFGAGGQDGFYMQQLCHELSIEPIGISKFPAAGCIQGDVSDYAQVEGWIKHYRPAYLFHLAANSTTNHQALFENHATISTGTLNVLECVRQHSPGAIVFITGSGVQFRNVGQPISEQDEFEARSAYAVARIQSVYAARYYRTLGVRAYVGYLFHHESPRRTDDHVAKMISSAARRIARGSSEKIRLGDMSVRKEWAFAGDIVRGIFTLVNQENVFEATIGTGQAYSIQDWLEQCFRVLGKDWREHVDLEQAFTPEYHCLVSNPKTIRSLGWVPKMDFPGLASLMMGV